MVLLEQALPFDTDAFTPANSCTLFRTRSGAEGDQENKNELLSGIVLGSTPLTWTFVGLTMPNTAYQHYTYAIFTRKLMITPSLVQVA